MLGFPPQISQSRRHCCSGQDSIYDNNPVKGSATRVGNSLIPCQVGKRKVAFAIAAISVAEQREQRLVFTDVQNLSLARQAS